MTDEIALFEQAAEILERAMAAQEPGEQEELLDEALRLIRLAGYQELARLDQLSLKLVKPAQDGPEA